LNTYGYVFSNPLRYTDPTGEFVPILIGIGIGLLFDYAVEEYKKANCECDDSGTPLGPVGNAAAGGSTGATGPFAKKPRGGIAGGGNAGDRTSVASKANHSASKRGYYSTKTRNRATSILRKVPYIGAGLAAYQLYDAVSCQ